MSLTPELWGARNVETGRLRSTVFKRREAAEAFVRRNTDNYTALEVVPLYARPSTGDEDVAGVVEDLKRRAEACRELSRDGGEDRGPRCAGKAAAYDHAAELVAALSAPTKSDVGRYRDALERIREATPANTNSHSAESMASWTHAVAASALDAAPEGWADSDGEQVLYAAPTKSDVPIPMVLHCPACGLQHIDEAVSEQDGEGREVGWSNPPHRSHLCHGCGHIWRPADVPTTGVEAVQTKGKADSPISAPTKGDDLRKAAEDVLALPGAREALRVLDRGIGTATPKAAWLRLRAALQAKEAGRG